MRLPLLYFLMGVIVTIGAATRAKAEELITLSLASGRALTGVIDARSSDAQLWLRRGDAEASITRPISWGSITKATRGGEELSIAELKALSGAIVEAQQAPIELPRWQGVFAERSSHAVDTSPPVRGIVRSLAIDAFHANWDSDVESDGLVILVYPLDAQGQVVPVTGSIEVELMAPEVRRFQDAPHGRGLTLERIGQWVEALDVDDFGSRGARVELPFQAIHPEFDTKILPHGLVHARLVVPGEGTFDATVEYMRVRPWSPLRDQYWRDTGRRFFPSEATGRAKRND